MSTALAIDPVRSFGPALPAEPVRPVEPLRAARPVAAAETRPRVLAGACLVAGVAAVVVTQLLLSIGTAQGAYHLSALEHRSTALSHQQQAQTEALRALAAPQRLAARAAALGMVPDDSPAYLDARTGKVLGSGAKVTGVAEAPGGIIR